MTQRFALVGHPISQSPSPAMHNAAFAHLQLDATYHLRPTQLQDVSALLAELQAHAWHGLNVTTPLKTLLAPHVKLDALAARAQAVNTLYHQDDGWHGTLTDIAGVQKPLAALNVAGGAALVLGAGGATRAAVLALEALECEVFVAARRPAEAKQLLGHLAPKYGGTALDLNNLLALEAVWPKLSVVVQGTPLGKNGERLALPWHLSSANLIAFDMLYRPRVTPFLADAEAVGARCIYGWQMLLHQGAPAFSLWTQQPAPLAIMQAALLASVDKA